jgi:hypothetical protein
VLGICVLLLLPMLIWVTIWSRTRRIRKCLLSKPLYSSSDSCLALESQYCRVVLHHRETRCARLLRSRKKQKVCDKRTKGSKCKQGRSFLFSAGDNYEKGKWVQRLAQKISVSASTAWNIRRVKSQLLPYKTQLRQPLSQGGIARHYVLAKDHGPLLEGNQSVMNVMWFSCEATFHLDAYIKKKNLRFWT